MNTSKPFLLFFIVFMVFSCSNDQKSNDAKLHQTIKDLEKNVEILNAELEDQKLKTRISFMIIRSNPSLIFNTPLENFFLASDDFFEGVVDAGLLNCQKNCVIGTCIKIKDLEERRQCYEDLAKSRNRCVQNCQKQFPISEKMPEPGR